MADIFLNIACSIFKLFDMFTMVLVPRRGKAIIMYTPKINFDKLFDIEKRIYLIVQFQLSIKSSNCMHMCMYCDVLVTHATFLN